jgi:uncharacterized protein
MQEKLEGTLEALEARLRGAGGLLVAFSGGVDSSLVLASALRARGADAVAAATVTSPFHPSSELELARRTAEVLGARHLVLELDPLSDPGLRANPPDRCYLCKRMIFGAMLDLARTEGLEAVVDGSNADDQLDFRPGHRALRELGVRSPLCEAGFHKDEVRELAHALGLSSWDRPAQACLASRIPYGRELTEAGLRRVDLAEQLLHTLGLELVRVRDHGDLARVEVESVGFARLFEPAARAAVVTGLGRLGYRYVTLDLEGYRTGSMNEALDPELQQKIEGDR